MSSPDWDWNRYIPYLRCRARLLRLDRRVRVRFDESDLVGETLQQAVAKQDQFRGSSEEERIAWLERVQDRMLIDLWRRCHADRRDVGREQDLQQALQDTTACWEHCLPAQQTSPSELAARRELLLRVSEAVERLPDDQRDIVLAVLLRQQTLQEVADQAGRTKGAVAGLYARGLARLREWLPDLRDASP